MVTVLVGTEPLHLQALNLVLSLLEYDFEYIWQPFHHTYLYISCKYYNHLYLLHDLRMFDQDVFLLLLKYE